MSDGIAQDDDESKKGADPFAHVPGYQPYNAQTPLWPGQQAQAAAPAQGQFPEIKEALPEGIRPLQLPSKPKSNKPNLQIGQPVDQTQMGQQGQQGQFGQTGYPNQNGLPNQQGFPNQHGQAGSQGMPDGYGARPGRQPQGQNGPQQLNFQQPQLRTPPQPQQQQIQGQQQYSSQVDLQQQTMHQQTMHQQASQQQPMPQDLPQQPQQNPQYSPQYSQQYTGNINAPPLPGHYSVGLDVGLDVGLPQSNNAQEGQQNAGQPVQPVSPLPADMMARPTEIVRPLGPYTQVITSASAKPDWNQPQWPGAKSSLESQIGGGPLTGRPVVNSGNQMPPQIAPTPQTPYSIAPPTSSKSQGFRSQLPFTIKRDLTLAKQLFGENARPVNKPQHEYKQTEYIPKAPTIRQAYVDPSAPWAPATPAQFEFYSEEEEHRARVRAQAQALAQAQMQNPGAVQPPVGFTNATQVDAPVVFDESNQPDPRYAPFQGELLKDIARQDRFAGHTEEPIPAERRERGAAALRALGRNSDKFYDSANQEDEATNNYTPAIRLTSRDLFGLVTYYFIVTKEVLLSPALFFNSMSLAGGLNDPLLYLAFTSIATGLLLSIAKLNLWLLFGASIWCFVSTAVGAVLVQLAFKKMGGQGKFEQTFNVLAYSKATFVLTWISLGPFHIGVMAATAFSIYLNYLGLSRVHKLPSGITWGIIAALALIPLIMTWK